MCTHMLHSNYTAYIWADGSFALQPGFVKWMLEHLGDADAVFFRHPERSTIVEEMEFVYSGMSQAGAIGNYLRARYRSEPMREQVQSYLQEGPAPEAMPLISSGLFLRRNTNRVNRAFEQWYIENTKWSIQDQLSLPYIIWKSGLRVNYIPGNLIYKGPYHNRPQAGIHQVNNI